MKIFIEWEWVIIVGYKEVLGRFVLYVIIKIFLDYFLLMLFFEFFSVEVFEMLVDNLDIYLLFKVLNEVLFES